MKNLLINTISEFGYPIMLQGSMDKNEKYPDHFFTFWNNETYDNSHYDNKANNYTWDFDLNFYSIDPKLVNTILVEAKEKLIKVGAVVSGKGYDVASDEPTHTGRGINVQFIE